MADIELKAGDATLAVDTRGGGMRALRVGDWDVLDGYAPGTRPRGRRGRVLAPWPNRIYQGRYTWLGVEHSLPISDPKHDSATHGLVDDLEWILDEKEDAKAMVSVDVQPSPGYPFQLRLGVTYSLSPNSLTVRVAAWNVGQGKAPFGVGMHPYFRCGVSADHTVAQLPATARLPLDDMGAPAGPLTSFDGDLGRLGDEEYDAALTGLVRDAEGWAHAVLAGPAGRITISVDEAWSWLMLFTGDSLPADQRRNSVAVEPMTCPPNAFATGTDVVTLLHDELWWADWRVSWEPA